MSVLAADLYQVLAEALAEPPGWLCLPGHRWPLYETASALAGDSAAARKNLESLANIPAEPLGARRSRYAALFNPENGLWLYESAALYGRIIGEETFTLARLYRAAGLETVGAELPDHISVELAFLAFLVGDEQDEGAAQHEVQFLQQHAGRWMPGLGHALARSGDPVYGPIGRLLADWLSERALARRPRSSERDASLPGPYLPAIPQADDCTLCGFCAQVCPTRVLTMRENQHETTLILRHDLTCTSCNKCAEVCEMGAIQMVPAEKLRVENTVLRRSGRPLCKGCQQPMISAAELEFVARQLGNPDWLAYCLDCRPQRMERRR
ncbi:MAG: 4Fe-4S dicluster domain-containing protein [Chloroflexi bacterium]|nr:4Fe-4S dicluster domain-containing protein [Chloroflexota bacterium]